MIYSVSDRETVGSIAASGGVGFTAAKLIPTGYIIHYAIVQVVDSDCRFCIDGTEPTSSKGLHLCEDESVEIWGATAMADFLAIDDSGTAKLEVIYMGVPA